MKFIRKADIRASKHLTTAFTTHGDEAPIEIFEIRTEYHSYLSLEQTAGGRTRNVVVRIENLDGLISALSELRRIYTPSTNHLGGNT